MRNLEKIQDKWLLFQRFVTSIVDHTKFCFYRFHSFLFIVVIVISILLKNTFSQISIHSQLLVKIL